MLRTALLPFSLVVFVTARTALADEPAAPPTEPPEPVPEEVTVRGRHRDRDVGSTSLSVTEVREVPGAFGEPFRAIEVLPGVTPAVSGFPFFFIRGAPPNNNGYFIDGVRVPLLFHVALGPGVIHPELLDRVDFHPGSAPARYGRFAGAILAGQLREPSPTFRGAANVRLFDVGALLESPFADGRGTALVAGRYGYPGPIVSAISDTKVAYWDYQSRVGFRVGDRDTLSVFAFGSHDSLGHLDEVTKQPLEDFVSDFHRIDLRWDRELEGGRARLAATFGHDRQGGYPTYLSDVSGAVRAEIEKQLGGRARIRAGADARVDVYSFEEDARDAAREPIVPSGVSPPPTNVAWGGYFDVVWRIAPRVELVPGVRVDVYESARRGPNGAPRRSDRVPAIDPRLAARVTLSPSVAFLSAIGLAHQYPSLRVGDLPAAILTGAGFPYGSPRLQRVAQASHGVEVKLPADLVLTTTAFLSSFRGLTDLTGGCIQIEPPVLGPAPPLPPGSDPFGPRRPPPPWICPNEQGVHGRAYGLEVLLRRPLTKRLTGWLAYTLSRSTREARFVRLDGSTAVATVPSEFDRTHALNAIVAYDLGRRWRVGSRFTVYSGAPYSALSGNVPVPPYNTFRDPTFFRLDLRIEKRWPLGDSGSIALVLEGQNVTASKEPSPLGTDCIGRVTPAGGTVTCKRAEIGPITLPSIGVEGFF